MEIEREAHLTIEDARGVGRQHVRRLHAMGLSGDGVSLALLDSGVDAGHPALRGRLDTFLHVDRAGDIVPDGAPLDTGAHGSHIAGILCGAFPAGSPALGVAPGAVLHVAAVIEGGKDLLRVLRGLGWVSRLRPRVLCLPIGIERENPILYPVLAAIAEAGTLVVCPSGNRLSGDALAPATYPGVLSVGACETSGLPLNRSGTLMDYSSATCLAPAVLAPGRDVWSCEAGGGVSRRTGTSQACAFVAGLAALLFEACPLASAAQLVAALCGSARHHGPEHRHKSRFGQVDPVRALDLLRAGHPGSPCAERERAAPDRFVDRRLDRPRIGDRSHVLEALVLVRPARDESYGAAAQRVIAEVARAAGGPPDQVELLPAARVARISASRRWVDELLGHPALWALSAPSSREPFAL